MDISLNFYLMFNRFLTVLHKIFCLSSEITIILLSMILSFEMTHFNLIFLSFSITKKSSYLFKEKVKGKEKEKGP